MSHHQHQSSVEKISAASLLVAFGIIYGDIGTSPLYVLKSIIGDRQITEELVFGGVSCIFWTLLIQTTIKYVWLTLQADNQGEGGIFSLYVLIRRYSKTLTIPAILGASTLLADGIITPPISVSSAIEGLSQIEGLSDIPTITIVIFIISCIFFFQRFGTQKVGSAFGPIMVTWFTMLFVLGLRYLIDYPSVIQALHPKYGYNLLVNYPSGFWLLGAVFLCTTGAEALYSDLGHCGRNNIRITWIMVKIALLTNYMGQSAWLLHSKIDYLNGQNPFFGIMPDWFLLSGIIIATIAAIVASQALISGSYTLINEAISLSFWPRVTTKQPTNSKGQIYIPSLNTLLWIGCILTVLYFKTSEHMEAAYGFFITVTMIMTTYLLSFYLYYRKKWNLALVIGIWVSLSVVEFSFFIANLVKLKDSWVFLFGQVGIFMLMYTWFLARKINNKKTRFVDLDDYKNIIAELSQDDNIPKFATHLIYLTKANHIHQVEEKVIRSILSRKPKRADVYWLLHIHQTEQPYTLSYDVKELLDDKLIKVNIHIGFRIQPRTEYYFKKIVKDLVANKELKLHIRPDGSTRYNNEPDFKFVVLEKFLSVENQFTIKESIILNIYFWLKRISLKDQKAFGLDKDDVVVEHIPLVYHPIADVPLKRAGEAS